MTRPTCHEWRNREADKRPQSTHEMMFTTYIGIDYSGKGTPLHRLPGLQVYAAQLPGGLLFPQPAYRIVDDLQRELLLENGKRLVSGA